MSDDALQGSEEKKDTLTRVSLSDGWCWRHYRCIYGCRWGAQRRKGVEMWKFKLVSAYKTGRRNSNTHE